MIRQRLKRLVHGLLSELISAVEDSHALEDPPAEYETARGEPDAPGQGPEAPQPDEALDDRQRAWLRRNPSWVLRPGDTGSGPGWWVVDTTTDEQQGVGLTPELAMRSAEEIRKIRLLTAHRIRAGELDEELEQVPQEELEPPADPPHAEVR